eukprot:GHVT01081204.1.p1 GENE.GHVT01081204.1~~GHVT01081204.1.p1  ORF type:complete len:911 (+),score=202.43 GHVT01081204.1:580-3312(+)
MKIAVAEKPHFKVLGNIFSARSQKEDEEEKEKREANEEESKNEKAEASEKGNPNEKEENNKEANKKGGVKKENKKKEADEKKDKNKKAENKEANKKPAEKGDKVGAVGVVRAVKKIGAIEGTKGVEELAGGGVGEVIQRRVEGAVGRGRRVGVVVGSMPPRFQLELVKHLRGGLPTVKRSLRSGSSLGPNDLAPDITERQLAAKAELPTARPPPSFKQQPTHQLPDAGAQQLQPRQQQQRQKAELSAPGNPPGTKPRDSSARGPCKNDELNWPKSETPQVTPRQLAIPINHIGRNERQRIADALMSRTKHQSATERTLLPTTSTTTTATATAAAKLQPHAAPRHYPPRAKATAGSGPPQADTRPGWETAGKTRTAAAPAGQNNLRVDTNYSQTHAAAAANASGAAATTAAGITAAAQQELERGATKKREETKRVEWLTKEKADIHRKKKHKINDPEESFSSHNVLHKCIKELPISDPREFGITTSSLTFGFVYSSASFSSSSSSSSSFSSSSSSSCPSCPLSSTLSLPSTSASSPIEKASHSSLDFLRPDKPSSPYAQQWFEAPAIPLPPAPPANSPSELSFLLDKNHSPLDFTASLSPASSALASLLVSPSSCASSVCRFPSPECFPYSKPPPSTDWPPNGSLEIRFQQNYPSSYSLVPSPRRPISPSSLLRFRPLSVRRTGSIRKVASANSGCLFLPSTGCKPLCVQQPISSARVASASAPAGVVTSFAHPLDGPVSCGAGRVAFTESLHVEERGGSGALATRAALARQIAVVARENAAKALRKGEEAERSATLAALKVQTETKVPEQRAAETTTLNQFRTPQQKTKLKQLCPTDAAEKSTLTEAGCDPPRSFVDIIEEISQQGALLEGFAHFDKKMCDILAAAAKSRLLPHCPPPPYVAPLLLPPHP